MAEEDSRRRQEVLQRTTARLAHASQCDESALEPVDVALDLMREGDTFAQLCGLELLAGMVQTRSATAASVSGAIAAVVALLRQRMGIGPVVALALRALARLVEPGAARGLEQAAADDAADAVVAGMQAHAQQEELQRRGCSVLTFLCGHAGVTPSAAAENTRGAVDAVLAAMRAFPDARLTQVACMDALTALCRQHLSNCSRAAAAGALDATLAALRAHASESEVRRAGYGFIYAILMHAEGRCCVTAASKRAVAGVAVAALGAQSSDAAVDDVLHFPLLTMFALSRDSKDVLCRAGALEAVMAVLPRLLEPHVLEVAYALIGDLAMLPAGAARAGEVGAVEACVAVLRRDVADGLGHVCVVRAALHALRNTIAGDAPNTARAHRAGAASVVHAAMRARGADGEVRDCAVDVLQLLQPAQPLPGALKAHDAAVGMQPAPSAAAAAAAAPGPDTLHVCVYVLQDDGALPLLQFGPCSLCDFLRGDSAIVFTDSVMVCMDDGGEPSYATATSARLRDVLLQKSPLPGFGMIPAEWVPSAARRNAELQALLADAPDVGAVRRMWAEQRVLDDDCKQLLASSVMWRLVALLEQDEARCEVPLPAADVDAVHAMALEALELSETSPRSAPYAALEVLGATARLPGVTPPAPSAALALMLAAVRAFEVGTEKFAQDKDVRMHLLMWLWWGLRRIPLAAPASEREAVRAFSRGGGAAFLGCVLHDELSYCRDAAGSDADVGNSHNMIILMLQALMSCHAHDNCALLARDGAVYMTRMMLCALHLPDAPPQTCSLALAFLAALMSRGAAAPEHADVMAACAASDVPEQASRLARECLGGTDAWARYACSAAMLWQALAQAADTWPGGAVALVARACAADARAALAAASHACARRSDFAGERGLFAEAETALQRLATAVAASAAEPATQPAQPARPVPLAAAAASGPESLRVRLYVGARSGHRCALLECMRGRRAVVCDDETTVSLDADDAELALLRDVLLRKAPLPGFGLLPPEWVSMATRRAAVQQGLLCAARDMNAVWSVWCALLARRGGGSSGDREDEELMTCGVLLHVLRLAEVASAGGVAVPP
jgi:hypothetical protein